jgi:hypothetical protein
MEEILSTESAFHPGFLDLPLIEAVRYPQYYYGRYHATHTMYVSINGVKAGYRTASIREKASVHKKCISYAQCAK